MNLDNILEANLRHEEALLLYGLRMFFNDHDQNNIKVLLEKELDWEYFLKITNQHGVTPLFYQIINQNCPNLLPEKIIDNLRQNYQNNALHNLFLSKELLKLIKILQSHNINALPYKGPVLATYLYNNIACRCCTDLDLLVLTKEFINVKNILEKEGYRLVSLVSNQNKFKEPLHWGHEYVLSTSDGKILIDVHQQIARSDFFFPFNINYLWDNLDKINFLNTELPMISAENLLLILAVHANKHCWTNLIWLCDIAQLIQLNPHLNFDDVLQKARELSNEKMLLFTFYLCQKVLGIKFPPHIQAKINNDSSLNLLSQKILENMFINSPKSIKDKIFYNFQFYLQLRNTLLGKFQQISASISFIINPNLRDWDFLPLPSYLYFLYYLIRPFRLIWKELQIVK